MGWPLRLFDIGAPRSVSKSEARYSRTYNYVGLTEGGKKLSCVSHFNDDDCKVVLTARTKCKVLVSQHLEVAGRRLHNNDSLFLRSTRILNAR